MTTRITMKLDGMECPNCAMILGRIADKLAGVTRAEASYHKAQMVVEFNETQISAEQIRAEVQRLGYGVSGMAAS